MEKTATDRRTERTKAKILEALLELSKEKSINEISIRELTERAKIHRNTFYIHYTDVYGILDDLENHMCTVAAEVTEQFTPQQLRENASDVLEIIFSYLKERREYCMLMLENRTRISVGQKVLESVFEKYLTAFEDSCDRQAFAFQVQFRYCTSGVIGIVLYWKETDDKRAGRRYFGGDCMKRQEPLMEAAESSFRAAGISDCFCREVRWEHVELSEVNFFKTSLRKMIQAVELSKRLGIIIKEEGA